MDKLIREEIPTFKQLGRTNRRAIGGNAVLADTMSCGFARFSLADGKMVPHKHEREIIYVREAKGVTARYGAEPTKLDGSSRLNTGDLLRFHDGEWHVFDMDDEDSYLEIFWVFDIPQSNNVDYVE